MAKGHFEAIVEDEGPSAEVLDGMGRVLWWLKDVSGAIEFVPALLLPTRTRASPCRPFASRCGLRANCGASSGTMPQRMGGWARAETIAEQAKDSPCRWLDPTRSG